MTTREMDSSLVMMKKSRSAEDGYPELRHRAPRNIKTARGMIVRKKRRTMKRMKMRKLRKPTMHIPSESRRQGKIDEESLMMMMMMRRRISGISIFVDGYCKRHY